MGLNKMDNGNAQRFNPKIRRLLQYSEIRGDVRVYSVDIK